MLHIQLAFAVMNLQTVTCKIQGFWKAPRVFLCVEKRFLCVLQLPMQGLTGNISFDKDGRRQDFTLDVVEITAKSETIRVSQFIFPFKNIWQIHFNYKCNTLRFFF